MSYFLFESECKGTTKNAHDQIFLKKNAIFLKKSAFLRKNRGHGLHFATVASGELVKHSADQGGVRRYNCVVKCEGAARTHDQIFLKKNAKKVCFFIFFGKNSVYRLHFATVASRRDPLVGGVIEGTNVSLNVRANSPHMTKLLKKKCNFSQKKCIFKKK